MYIKRATTTYVILSERVRKRKREREGELERERERERTTHKLLVSI